MGILEFNAKRKADKIEKYLTGYHRVLDFGCGDLSLGRELYNRNKSLRITGIEIVDFQKRHPQINFRLFDGKTIPFRSRSFDVVFSYHVFHHTVDPEASFSECLRVAKHKLIFIEPVYRWLVELPGMIITDWLFNAWKREGVPMTYAFRSLGWWSDVISKYGFHLDSIEDVEPLPRYSPTGRSILFNTSRTSL